MERYVTNQSSCSTPTGRAPALGLPYEYKPVNITKGEQFSPDFKRLNPLHFVPVLVDGDITVSASYAILLYLEDKVGPEESLSFAQLNTEKGLLVQIPHFTGV